VRNGLIAAIILGVASLLIGIAVMLVFMIFIKKKHKERDPPHDKSVPMRSQPKEKTLSHERTTSSDTQPNEEYLPKLSRSELPPDDPDNTLL
jgi:flagellar basal body-associated protein FliL